MFLSPLEVVPVGLGVLLFSEQAIVLRRQVDPFLSAVEWVLDPLAEMWLFVALMLDLLVKVEELIWQRVMLRLEHLVMFTLCLVLQPVAAEEM
jgi:hypothetical protein